MLALIDLTEKLRGHRILIAGSLLVLAGALSFFGKDMLGQQVDSVVIRRSDILQTVVASGRVETPLRIDIGSQVTGTVAAIPVTEGQAVQAGLLLIELENSEAKAAVAQARATASQAQARLRQLREVSLPTAQQNMQQAQINLQNVQRQYERTKELRRKEFVGQAALDDAQQKLDLAQSQLRSTQVQAATNAPEGSDTQIAQVALEQAQAGLQMAQARLSYTRIAAPIAGTLIARNVERGDVVQPGKMLMVLSPAGQTQLVLQIDEKNLASLQLGQTALASADAYPEQRFGAQVAYINPAVDPQRGSVEIKLNVAQPPAYLRQDMTVSVDIEVARRTKTLVAPIGVVHDSVGNAPWVMRVKEGRAQRQPVKLGVRGGGLVEITSGVQEGDQVLATGSLHVAEGQRVRTHPLPPASKPGA